MTFEIKFWGVRGSIACPTANHIRYGGNTSCIEVFIDDRIFVLDAGTGMRELGQEFLDRDVREAHLLLTHTHWDHISGFPFFTPAYDPARSIHIMAGHLTDVAGGIQGALSAQMDSPMFPIPLEAMQANIRFEDFRAGESFSLYSEVKVKTAALNHPNGSTGYRIEYGGKSLCYVTDTEHVEGQPDQNILNLIDGADLVIYDSMYTQEEYQSKVGWGHSTWNEGMNLCRAANVKRLAIFHHEPVHHDDFMDKLSAEASAAWDGCFVTKEGMTVKIE